MKPKTAVILIVLLAAVLLVMVVRHAVVLRQPAPTAAAPQTVWPTAPGEPIELTIEPAGRAKTRFVKTEGQWRIAEPVAAKARSYPVSEVVRAMKDLSCLRAYAPGDSEAPSDEVTGLDKPLWVVTLKDADGETHSLQVGRAVPLSGDQSTYVRPVGSGRICVVGVDLSDRLDKRLADFRDPTVLDLPTERVAGLRVAGKEPIELARRDSQWFLVSPVAAPADQDAADKLVRKAARLTADEFVDDDPGDLGAYGLAPGRERLTATIELAEQPAATEPESRPALPAETHTLSLGNKAQDKVYARLDDSPSVFLLPASLADDLQPRPIDLRRRTVLSVRAADVLRIELDLPAGQAEFVRRDDQWQMTRPHAGPADAQAVRDLLEKIDALKAESFRDETPELSKTVGRIVIHQAGTEGPETLLLGPPSPSGEMTFVQRAASQSVAVVKTADVAALLAAPAAYWDPDLFELPAGASIESLALKRRDGEFSLGLTADGWRITKPLAAEADAEHLPRLLDRMEKLKASKIVALAEQPPAPYAKAAEHIDVTAETVLTVQTQPAAETQASRPATQPEVPAVRQTLRLRIVRLDGKSFAWVEGRKPVAVGEFDAGLYETFAAELRDRSVWTFKPDDIATVRIASGAEALELRRRDGAWTSPNDPYVKIDAGKVESFLKDLAAMKADRFVAHAAPDAAKLGLDKPRLAVTLTPADGQPLTLRVSQKGQGSELYATAAVPGAFLVEAAAAAKFEKQLKDFKSP